MGNITAKQKRFCDEYIIDLNATQAAIRAGYSPKRASEQAYQLLQKTTLKEYIADRMAEKDAELIASQDEVLKYLTRVMRGESQSEIVVIESVGDFMTQARAMQKAPDEKERLRAAELLGKRYGVFTDRVEQQVDLDLNITIDYGDESDSDDDLK